MGSQVANNLRFRRSFGRIKKIIEIPNLIEIQKRSYDEFHERGMTYAAPLKVTIQLVIWDVDPESGARSIKNVKEQEVYFGEIPLMTEHGTFMINGTERVIVSQLHRSPGVFFDHDKGKTHASGKLLYSARIIPYRGSWVDFEFDPRDILFVRIDRRRKFHATVLLRALGMTTENLLNYYYQSDTIVFEGRKPSLVFKPDQLAGVKAGSDVRDPKSNELIVREGKKFTRPLVRQMELSRIKHVAVAWEDVLGRVAAHNIVDPENRKVLVECNQEITQERLDLIRDLA